MSTNKINNGFALGITLLICACGGGSSGTGTPVTQTSAQGNWIQDCVFSTEDGDYEQSSLLIEGNDFTTTQTSFSDQNCTERTQASTVTGTFTEGGTIAIQDRGDATEIDLTISAVAVTLYTNELATSAMNAALCANTSWAVGVSVDVSNCTEISGTEAPRTLFDIYLRDGDLLFTGSEAGESADSRPSNLDQSAVYRLVVTGNPVTNGEMQDTGMVTLPESSLPITSANGVNVAQFVVSHFEMIKGLTNAGNTAVISAAGNNLTRVTDLYISSFCEGGGSASINGTPAVLSNLTASYTDCVIDGVTYNGTMSMMFVSTIGVLGNPDADWSYSAGVEMVEFSVNTGERNISITGDFILTMLHRASTEIPGGVTGRFQGIQDEVIFFNEADAITRMIDFDFLFIYNANNPVVYSEGFDEARLASSTIGGQISVESSGVTGFGFDTPDSGEIEVFGANSSRMIISAEGSDSATISVDADGNGEFTDADDIINGGSWSGFFGF